MALALTPLKHPMTLNRGSLQDLVMMTLRMLSVISKKWLVRFGVTSCWMIVMGGDPSCIDDSPTTHRRDLRVTMNILVTELSTGRTGRKNQKTSLCHQCRCVLNIHIRISDRLVTGDETGLVQPGKK